MSIYCMKWYEGEENPFADQAPTNSRAEAMMEGSDRHSEEKNTALGKDSRGGNKMWNRLLTLVRVRSKTLE